MALTSLVDTVGGGNTIKKDPTTVQGNTTDTGAQTSAKASELMAKTLKTLQDGKLTYENPLLNTKTGQLYQQINNDLRSAYKAKNATPYGSVSQAVVAGRADPVSNAVLPNSYTVYDGKNRTAISQDGQYITGYANGAYNTNTTDTGGDEGDKTDYYQLLLDAFKSGYADERNAAIEAIMKNLDAVKGTYKSQIEQIMNEYNGLIDENEVAKERTRRAIKERQANRGQLDSGLGRQEQLDLEVGYDNATSDLKLAREQAINEIYNLITQAEAEAASNKATINNSYNQSLLSLLSNQ